MSRSLSLLLAAWLSGAGSLSARQADSNPPAKAASPFGNEALSYSVNWPSGLSLGEARLRAHHAEGRWTLEFSLDASVPGFAISDSYKSTAGGDFCSVEFLKQATHGKKKADEKTTFEAQKGVATRVTLTPTGGGKSELAIPSCARDALAFLFHLRRELSLGRLPGSQTVYFGAPYQLRIEYGGLQQVRVNDQRLEADRLIASLKGPASEVTFELFFSRDAARTPLMVRVPLALGTFSMELVR